MMPSSFGAPIVGFHQDEHGHWVAELACGHQQHVRHDPPLRNRPWVLTEAGRQQFMGTLIPCKHCLEQDDQIED
ncbi:MAG: DUF3565 domain-containing protein [Chloroflexota bacterium]